MKIVVKNHIGQSVELDPFNYPVVSVDGLTPTGATINTSNVATVDGTFFNSSYVNQRNIVLTITPNVEAERARLFLYQYFKPKYPVTLYFKTRTRDVYIEGYVETFEGSLYDQKQSFQISVICPQPFFNDVKESVTELSKTVNNFTFPFYIPEEGVIFSYIDDDAEVNVKNKGEETTGAIIQLVANGHIVEPTIYNRTTGDKFTIMVEMSNGDNIVIDTRRGQKTIEMISDGVTTNILNKIAKGSKWLSLVQGDNIFRYDCVRGAKELNIIYTFHPLYGGI